MTHIPATTSPPAPGATAAAATGITPTVRPAETLSATRPPVYSGVVVYIFAFDIAYDMSRAPLKELLGQPVAQFAVDASKRNPRQLFFYRAEMVRLPTLERIGPRGPLRLDRTVKLLPVGAISIRVRAAFQVERLSDLVAYHDLKFTSGVYLYDEVMALAEEVRKELAPHAIRPVAKLVDEEAYTVFCLKPVVEGGAAADPAAMNTETWLARNRREVAALLTEEDDASRLSEQEAVDSTSKYLSYYGQDLVVVDWDAALVMDEPRNFDETLYLMELANVQLAEMEAYDRLLDDVLENSYRDLSRRHPIVGYSSSVQRSLREIRIDLARLSDELLNITKFFGDWHMARTYKTIADRFHLSDWHRTIDDKLKTLDDMYQLLAADRNNRMMLTLEVAIVVLFIVDVVILVMEYR